MAQIHIIGGFTRRLSWLRLDLRGALLVVLVSGALFGPGTAAEAQTGAATGASGQAIPADAVPQQIQPRQQTDEILAPEIREVLGRYGSFLADDLYGEVWTPTATPSGWHPYPPCHWVKANRWGLYYDDPSEWGRIVHHFGRWVHDASRGWLWIPGAEFSPAWVVWRSSRTWTGWAPLPPANDEALTADAMAAADSWLFQETPLVLAGCQGDRVAAPAQVSSLLIETPYVTRIGFWNDMAVPIVPSWIAGPYVQIKLSFKPWPHSFVASVAGNWNFIWHHTTTKNVKNVCLRRSPKGI